MTYIMGQMRGAGKVAQLFGISIPAGVIAGAALFCLRWLGRHERDYVHAGGSYCVMAFAYTIPAIFIAMALTGNVVPQLGLIGNYTAGGESVPFLDKLNAINTELGFAEYTSGKLSTINMFCITAALMCGTAGLPHVIVRFFTVKDVKAVRTSACWTLGFIAVIYLTAPTIVAFSRVNLVDKLHNTPYTEVPGWFQEFEKRARWPGWTRMVTGVCNISVRRNRSRVVSRCFRAGALS